MTAARRRSRAECRTMPVPVRLERLSARCPVTGCWFWLSELGGGGYGRLTVNGVRRSAHRLSYELIRGPIPEGLTLDHLCRQRSCINPDHLEVVTSRENSLRGYGVGAMCARQTHCKRGHAFTPEGVVMDNGAAECRCRRCDSERSRRARAKAGHLVIGKGASHA